MKGFHDRIHHADAPGTQGLLLYRFGAGIVFYNASYLKKRVLDLAAAQPDLKWAVIDGNTINTIDSTGAETLEALARDLDRQGIQLRLAGFRTEPLAMLERAGTMSAVGTDRVHPTLKSAVSAFLATRSEPQIGVPSREPPAPDAAKDCKTN
jgi:MFS superfamily sulfate permease-like transporter